MHPALAPEIFPLDGLINPSERAGAASNCVSPCARLRRLFSWLYAFNCLTWCVEQFGRGRHDPSALLPSFVRAGGNPNLIGSLSRDCVCMYHSSGGNDYVRRRVDPLAGFVDVGEGADGANHGVGSEAG